MQGCKGKTRDVHFYNIDYVSKRLRYSLSCQSKIGTSILSDHLKNILKIIVTKIAR